MPCQLCHKSDHLVAVPVRYEGEWRQFNLCVPCADSGGAYCRFHNYPHRLEGDRTVCGYCELERDRARVFAREVLGALTPPLPIAVAEFLTTEIDRRVLQQRSGSPAENLARLLVARAHAERCTVEEVISRLTDVTAVAELLGVSVPTVMVIE